MLLSLSNKEQRVNNDLYFIMKIYTHEQLQYDKCFKC